MTITWGIVLLLLGLFILLGSFGLIAISFWKIVLWLIAIGFVVSGSSSMIKNKFPNGLVSLSAGIILILQLVNVINIGFWSFIGVVAGIWLIQQGFFYLMPHSHKERIHFTWYRRNF